MSFNVTPFEQLAAEALTGLIITGGQGGNAANIVKRANTALAIASAVAQITNGNAAAGVSAIQTALANTSLDPAVGLAVQGLFSIGAQQLALNASLMSALPIFGTTAEAIAANISAGVVAAANAELAKYAPAPTPAA